MKTLEERISDLEREVQSLRQEIKRSHEATLTIHVDPDDYEALVKAIQKGQQRLNDLEKNTLTKLSEDHVQKQIEESLRFEANQPISALKGTQILAQCLKASEKTDPK